MICYMCGREYAPDPERVKAWADSGATYDPTDWACDECVYEETDYEEPQWVEATLKPIDQGAVALALAWDGKLKTGVPFRPQMIAWVAKHGAPIEPPF